MTKTNKIIIGIMLIAIMLLEIGYAAMQNVTLNISGTVTAEASKITNANIGDYIDLGNNIVGTDSTSDDWRILYVDGDTVYAILAELLPNNTMYAENARFIYFRRIWYNCSLRI